MVTLQADSVKRYNKIVRDQFEVHRIIERMDAVDKMTKILWKSITMMATLDDH